MAEIQSFHEIDPAKAGCAEKTVRKEDLAVTVGSGSLAVLATPVLSCWMEEVCHLAAAEGQEEGRTSVGASFSLQHLAPTAEGRKVRICAEETERGTKSLRYHIVAFDEAGKIGEAEHVRVYVNETRFMDRLAVRYQPAESDRS